MMNFCFSNGELCFASTPLAATAGSSATCVVEQPASQRFCSKPAFHSAAIAIAPYRTSLLLRYSASSLHYHHCAIYSYPIFLFIVAPYRTSLLLRSAACEEQAADGPDLFSMVLIFFRQILLCLFFAGARGPYNRIGLPTDHIRPSFPWTVSPVSIHHFIIEC